MRILLSNDDGILAPGLAAMVQAAAGLGELFVVAPDSSQSAAGHAITLTHPLVVKRLRVQGACSFDGISVDGRPADCVRLAIRNLLPQRPDLVLSGINAGSNVGINVFYSGTVAAATEGAMLGIPSIAISASMTGQVDFGRFAELARGVIQKLLAAGLRGGDLVNVNLPPLEGGAPKGIVVTRQSTAGIEDIYEPQAHEGKESYRLGESYGFAPGDLDSDVIRLAEGFITVTPLQIDRTDHRRLGELTRRDWGV